jgi:hypothetical protein
MKKKKQQTNQHSPLFNLFSYFILYKIQWSVLFFTTKLCLSENQHLC